jgi:hypothetical protein
MNDSSRFEYFLDPAGQWTIWDNRLDCPMCLSGAVMIGLSKSQARSICRLLNDLCRLRREGVCPCDRDAIDLGKRS